jgi:hypothetical protein
MPKLRRATLIRKRFARRTASLQAALWLRDVARDLFEDVVSGHGQKYSDYYIECPDRKQKMRQRLEAIDAMVLQLCAVPNCSSRAQRDTTAQLITELECVMVDTKLPTLLSQLQQSLRGLCTDTYFVSPYNKKRVRHMLKIVNSIKF